MSKQYFDFLKKRAGVYKGTYPNKPIVKIVTAGYTAQVLSKLDAVGIRYAVLGGHALAFQGYNRTTQDIDILVEPGDIDRIIGILDLQATKPLTIGGMSGQLSDGTEVDLVSPAVPWLADALSNAQSINGLRVLSKPFIVLSKIWASRGAQEDLDSMQMLKRMTPEEIVYTKRLVKLYYPANYDDLKQLNDMKNIV